ncbi:MAG: LptF/LptG family permease [Ignavibacteria bacterium]|nr:LptF/LptG family permease [Ignavibacteria bacterium]
MLIYRYILKAHIAPFFISFFLVVFVFTFQFIYKYIDILVGKGLSWWVITQLISLNLAWMVTLAVPMAVLVSTIMAFGMLSSNNETVVMMSSGISPLKLIIPVILVSSLLCYGLIFFNNKVLPEANYRTKVLFTDIQRTRPVFIIEPGRFTEDINGYSLLVNKTYPNSNKIEGIFIIDNSSPVFFNTVTADSGTINFSSDNSKMIIDLYNGQIHQMSRKNYSGDYRKIDFSYHIVSVDAGGFKFTRSDESAFSRGDRELSADSMRKIISAIRKTEEDDIRNTILLAQQLAVDFHKLFYELSNTDSLSTEKDTIQIQALVNRFKSLKNKIYSLPAFQQSTHRQINMYLVEIYKKYSIPFACIVFVLIGAPLGIITKRGGFGLASGISFGFFLLYWICLIGGEKLADREIINPLLSMWSANVILGFIGLYLIFRNNINFAIHKLKK